VAIAATAASFRKVERKSEAEHNLRKWRPADFLRKGIAGMEVCLVNLQIGKLDI